MRGRLGIVVGGVLPGLLAVGHAGAQVLVNPNQINGELRHVTANPTVQAHLDQGQSGWSIVATSTVVVPELVHVANASTPARAASPYEVSVETSASGIAYRVDAARSYTGSQGYERYTFAPVTSAPVQPEPAPDVLLDVRECAALIQVRWETPTGGPAPITSATLRAWRETVRGNLNYSDLQSVKEVTSGPVGEILVRGDGATYVLHLSVVIGTDPMSDRVRYEARASGPADCDDVIELTHVIPDDGGGSVSPAPDDGWMPESPPGAGGAGTGGNSAGGPPGGGSIPTGPFTFGRIVGRFDILGESEHRLDNAEVIQKRSLVWAVSGPWMNDRYDHFLASPSSGAFELERLVPSSAVRVHSGYDLQVRTLFRTHDRLVELMLPRLTTRVEDGQTVDLGDRLVIEPGFLSGEVALKSPTRDADGLPPLLRTLWRWTEKVGADDDGDGVPELPSELFGTAAVETKSKLPGGVAGDAAACFTRAFDATGATLAGDYEVVVSPGWWAPPSLQLAFRDIATPDAALTYVDERLLVTPASPAKVEVAPGQRVVTPHRYCLGEVRLQYHATAGTFHSPRISNASTGEFAGVDFEGNDVAYTVLVEDAQGTPRSGAPETDGLVVALLPQGEYTLHPRVFVVNPGGGSSDTGLQPIAMTMGCESVVEVHLDLSISMDAFAACVAPGPVTVSGRVASAQAITRITVAVNGGTPADVCVGCGISPTFSTTVVLGEGESRIVVTVEGADGRVATATSVVTSGREPSALDLYPTAEPLRVRRQRPSELVLTWEDVGSAGYSVYEGTIASLHDLQAYDHHGIGVDGLTVPSAVIPMPRENAYYLVGGPCGPAEVSLGRDSFGKERPGAPRD